MSYAEKIQHAGLSITLNYDGDTESPLEWDDGVDLAIWDRDFINPMEGKGVRDFESFMSYLKDDGGFAIPVRLSYHSMAGPRDYYALDWDDADDADGMLLFTGESLRKLGWKRMTAKRRKEVRGWADSILEEYSKWASGECYWYDITNAVGDSLDTCGGYIGYEYALEQAKEAAEYCAKAEAERMKTYTATKIDEDGDEEEHAVEAVSMKDALRQLDFEPLRLELSA